jgi:hypothetical protein
LRAGGLRLGNLRDRFRAGGGVFGINCGLMPKFSLRKKHLRLVKLKHAILGDTTRTDPKLLDEIRLDIYLDYLDVAAAFSYALTPFYCRDLPLMVPGTPLG